MALSCLPHARKKLARCCKLMTRGGCRQHYIVAKAYQQIGSNVPPRRLRHSTPPARQPPSKRPAHRGRSLCASGGPSGHGCRNHLPVEQRRIYRRVEDKSSVAVTSSSSSYSQEAPLPRTESFKRREYARKKFDSTAAVAEHLEEFHKHRLLQLKRAGSILPECTWSRRL